MFRFFFLQFKLSSDMINFSVKKIKIYGLYVLSILILSCNKDIEIETYEIDEVPFLVIETERGLRNQELPFMLKGENEEDYTDLATFYVNENAINGNIFSSPSEGIFEVYAQYNLAGASASTPIQTIEVFQPKRKVLIEDYTGTWCGYCPRMTTFVHEAMGITDHVAVISIHGNSVVSGTDPLTIDEGMFLKNHFEVPGYPWGIINRGEVWDENDISNQINLYAGIDVDTSIGIKSELIDDNLVVEVSIISENNLTNKKIVVFLLEDEILKDQASYYDTDASSPWYQMGNPIIDFEHNDVLRMSLTNPLGDAIASTAAFNVFTSNYSVTIPTEFNLSNLKIAVIVVNEDNTAVNTQIASINEVKVFE
ncbi:MAG: thiol-disulfide isomerase/thioredoxin [Sediminicola sp.]|jgi:thiol-disulfide isomerase/thioredoxin